MRSFLLKISTVIINYKIENLGRAMVQDLKVHHGAVTGYQTGDRQHLKRWRQTDYEKLSKHPIGLDCNCIKSENSSMQKKRRKENFYILHFEWLDLLTQVENVA